MKKLAVGLILCFSSFSYLAAQSGDPRKLPELNTDRPDRGQGPTVIPKGTVQIETGLQLQKDRSNSFIQQEYLYPATMVRLGLFSRAELRVNFEYKKTREKILPVIPGQETAENKGFNDVRLETKINLFKGQGLIPQVGVWGAVTLPVGPETFKPLHAAPGVSLLFSHKLSQKAELQYNIGYQKQGNQDEYQGQTFYALNTTRTLKSKIKGYLEIFGEKLTQPETEHNLDAGLLFLIRPNLHADIMGGWGLNEAAPGSFAGGGLTWRLPR